MKSKIILPAKELESFVKSIIILENDQVDANSRLPFFADGCPGIMFQRAPHGVYRKPKNKKLSEFFLYGQTILPIELAVKGTYQFVVFQLFPFAARTLLGVNPKALNDECYDLRQVKSSVDVEEVIDKLKKASTHSKLVRIISSFLLELIRSHKNNDDKRIQLAIQLILNSRGKITIKDLRSKLYITERTFERQFILQVGVTPKQFAKIIQFQYSMNQLSEENHARLADIVYDSGFADQSHFIRNFKKFAGKTPAEFQRTMKA